MPIKLSASILSADFAKLADQVKQAEDAGIDWVHIDVMDGDFVPNISMGPFIVETCKRITNLPLDVHLMISNPDRHLKAFIDAGADWISVHVESNPNLHRTLQTIREMGVHPSVVINPGTPVAQILPVLDIVDMVLVMSVNPGYSGQSFLPSTPARINALAALINAVDTLPVIEVDGGITPQTLPSCFEAGAQIFVAATSIFRHPDSIEVGVNALRSSILIK
jgi:ribulose-phosphate 3-epimerase